MSNSANIGYQLSRQMSRSVTSLSFCPIFRTNVGIVMAYAYASTAANISAARIASGYKEGDVASGCIVIATTTTANTTPVWVNSGANNSCTWRIFDQ